MIRDRFDKVRVECYAGYRGEEEPRRFVWKGRQLDVVEIADRWLDPTHRYFKVLASDGAVYLLRHDVDSGEWELTHHDRDHNVDSEI
jgi:hypothetical protein